MGQTDKRTGKICNAAYGRLRSKTGKNVSSAVARTIRLVEQKRCRCKMFNRVYNH